MGPICALHSVESHLEAESGGRALAQAVRAASLSICANRRQFDNEILTTVFAPCCVVGGQDILGYSHQAAVNLLAQLGKDSVIPLTICLSSVFTKYQRSRGYKEPEEVCAPGTDRHTVVPDGPDLQC